MVNIKTVLLALPTLYLFIALVFLSGRGVRPDLPATQVSPPRVLFVNTGAVPGGNSPPAQVAQPAAPVPVADSGAPPEPKVRTGVCHCAGRGVCCGRKRV